LKQSQNFRRYFIGQTISLSGTWMQTVAQGWLVLQLTGSGTAVGVLTALQFLPVLFLGPVGGLVVDRFDTRRLLLATQLTSGLLALVLGVLVATGWVRLWMVFVLAVMLGVVTVVDNPARQSFVMELVGPELLTNAITLNSVNINAARVVGPAMAAALIALIGLAPCFLLNAASYVAVVVALLLIDRSQLHVGPIIQRAKGQVREGLKYVWRTPSLKVPLIMMALIGTLAYEFQVILPLTAEFTYNGTAATYGLLTGAMGAGAVVGGLLTASRVRHGLKDLTVVSAAFGVAIWSVALAPTLPVAVAALVIVGGVSIVFLARANTLVQLRSDPMYRGRVMALWTVAFLGTTPVGGPIIGWIGEHLGPRYGLATGATSCLVAAAYGALHLRRRAAVDLDASEARLDVEAVAG
jgi:MFS family permease